jgi:hypothetical protein
MKIHSTACIQLSRTSVTASEKMFCHMVTSWDVKRAARSERPAVLR